MKFIGIYGFSGFYYFVLLTNILWSDAAAPGPIINVRSAKAGDLCSPRRDAILLVNPSSDDAYLQCLHGENGSNAIWKEVLCEEGQKFSYSRQRCQNSTSIDSFSPPMIRSQIARAINSSRGAKQVGVSASATKPISTTTSPKQHRTQNSGTKGNTKEKNSRKSTTGPNHHPTVTVQSSSSSSLLTAGITTKTTKTTLATSPSTRRRVATTTTTTTTEPTTTTPTATVAFNPQLGFLGSPCKPDFTCVDPNSVCMYGMCNCIGGYTMTRNVYGLVCVPEILTSTAPMRQAEIGEYCSYDRGPICGTPNAECRRNVCRCHKGHTIVDNACVIVQPKPGDYCMDKGESCTGGSLCIEDKCVCKEGETVENGLCVRNQPARPGEPCEFQFGSETNRCSGGSYCWQETGTCTCPDDYVIIDWTCASKIAAIGQPCQTPPQTCADGGQCVENTCRVVERAEMIQDTSPTCPNGWIPVEVGTVKICQPAMLQLGDKCVSPSQTCTGGSLCQNGQCACPDSFAAFNNYCLPVLPAPEHRRALGTSCVDHTQCSWAAGVCEHHCVCPFGSNVVLGGCRTPELPYSVAIGGYCNSDVHCVPGLSCVYRICICAPGFDCEKHPVQPPPPGSSCAFTQQCSGNAMCTNGWCVCAETHAIVENGQCLSATKRQKPEVPTNSTLSSAVITPITPTFAMSDGFQPQPILPGLLPNGLALHPSTQPETESVR